MGGCCCCASGGAEVNNPPPFHHYPTASVRGAPLSSNHGPVSVLSTGLLVDTNLDTTIPETYRPPPAPVPYDIPIGRPVALTDGSESCGNNNVVQPTSRAVPDANSGRTQEAAFKGMKSDKNTEYNTGLPALEEAADDLDKCGDPKKPCDSVIEEEEVCPTCLEEYDIENPKIITKCDHHFHLACILEWKERSDTCPVCDQEMVFSMANESARFETEVGS